MSRLLETTIAIGRAALGLLAFLLGCSRTFIKPQNWKRDAKGSLTGVWENDKGTKIVINHNINAVFSGFYLTVEGATNNTILPVLLQGIQHLEPQPTFDFILIWKTSASTAVLVGQCFHDEKGKEQLKTTWLLRRKLTLVAENWKATSIGTDTFYRIK